MHIVWLAEPAQTAPEPYDREVEEGSRGERIPLMKALCK